MCLADNLNCSCNYLSVLLLHNILEHNSSTNYFPFISILDLLFSLVHIIKYFLVTKICKSDVLII